MAVMNLLMTHLRSVESVVPQSRDTDDALPPTTRYDSIAPPPPTSDVDVVPEPTHTISEEVIPGSSSGAEVDDVTSELDDPNVGRASPADLAAQLEAALLEIERLKEVIANQKKIIASLKKQSYRERTQKEAGTYQESAPVDLSFVEPSADEKLEVDRVAVGQLVLESVAKAGNNIKYQMKCLKYRR